LVHLSGSIVLIRAFLARAPGARVLAASAVLAGALALAGCYGDDGYQLPTRAMKELSPEMLAMLDQKQMPKESPVLIRIFKEESELEVWKQDTGGQYQLLKVYPICRWSGDLGPKVKEGDRQAPEGFYAISPGLMNPNSSYYLAINIGFPNAYDRANGRSGAFLMIHGDCSSRGCYAMTDEQIGEIYSLAREAFLGGQKTFQIQAYPFRMTPANMARHRNSPNFAFWQMIKEGNDHFMVSHMEPKVDVCERRYVFDAQQPANSTKPLVFNPTGSCPKFELDPAIAEAVMDKRRNDDYQYAELVRTNAPVAPLTSGTDGGMNRVFVAKLDTPVYTYDDAGHVHVPPLQPGRLPPAISPPRSSQSDTTAAIPEPPARDGTPLSSMFGGLFGSGNSGAAVASSDASAQSHSGFFGSLFGRKHDGGEPASTTPLRRPQQTATATASPKIKPKLKVEPARPVPQEAAAVRPRTQPQTEQQASAASADPHLIKGAQPVVPGGNFDSRWGGFQ
jgi:murein L,D-transpeptidase YafK